MNASTPSRTTRTVRWTAQVVAAAILGMAAVPKLVGAPETIALFETLGAGAYGRITLGVFEALAVVLLLVPRTAAVGGLLAAGILAGAVGAHLTILGVVYNGDPSLFVLAVVGLAAGATVAWMRRNRIPVLNQFLASAGTSHATS
jgi:hypothetical protein